MDKLNTGTRTELFSAAGLYSPTFLKMHIDSRESLGDVFNLSEMSAAAFTHEYVHYLQDMTTIFGLRNIITVVDFMKTVNMDQRESGSRIMKIPYQIDKSKVRAAHYNGPILRLVAGRTDYFENNNLRRITTRTERREQPPEINEIEVVELHLTNVPNTHFDFGSHSVLESMAYLIEQALYPGVLPPSNNLCYHAVKKIGMFVYPSFSEDPCNLISLCDASLMYSNPGAVYYNMLIRMEKQGFKPGTYDEIYQFVFSTVHQTYAMLTEWDHILANHTLTAISQLNDYFTVPAFESNKAWIDFTLRNANAIRNKDRTFFSNLASKGPIKNNETFKVLFTLLGVPMMTNSDAFAWFATNATASEMVRPEILWAINQIYNIYINSGPSRSRRCGLNLWCQESCKNQNIEDYTDHRCFESPWERGSDGNGLCTFSQVWLAWGMGNEIPTQ